MKINIRYSIIVFLLVLFSFAVSTANASVDCIGDREIFNETDFQNLVAENCRTISGALIINSPTLTNLDGLESLNLVGDSLEIVNCSLLNDLTGLQNLNDVYYDLLISNNDSLTSLEGLNNIEEITGDWVWIADNDNLASLDALYDTAVIGNYLGIYRNNMLSLDEAYALLTNWSPPNGIFNGHYWFVGNGGSLDTDNDGIVDSEDNCKYNCNTQQLDADNDGTGDVCDATPGCGGCGSSCETEC